MWKVRDKRLPGSCSAGKNFLLKQGHVNLFESMKIQVLGSGCPSCKSLYKSVETVAKKLDSHTEIEYSDDIAKIIKLGAISSPVFVINDQIISAGAILSREEIEKAITDNNN